MAALACLVCKLLTGSWPWELAGLGGGSLAASKARRLLGVMHGASADQIHEAHRRLMMEAHPDRGGSNEAVHAANAARDLLLAKLLR